MTIHVIALHQPEPESKAEFSEFWNLYPRHIAKAHALKMWQKLSTDEQRQALAAVPLHVRYWRAKGTETEYIPHPGSWLNGRRFEDEIEIPKSNGTAQWWASNKGIEAKAAELGITARNGESWHDLKARVNEALSQ